MDLWKNGPNEQKFGQAVRVLRSGVETHAVAKAHTKAWPNGRLVKPRVRRGVAELCRSEGLHRSVAVLRWVKPLFTAWKIAVFWFCFISVAPRTRLLEKLGPYKCIKGSIHVG